MTGNKDNKSKNSGSVKIDTRKQSGSQFQRHKEVSSFSGLETAAPDTTKSTKRTTGSSEKTGQNTGNRKS
jgi:hypothetical protein